MAGTAAEFRVAMRPGKLRFGDIPGHDVAAPKAITSTSTVRYSKQSTACMWCLSSSLDKGLRLIGLGSCGRAPGATTAAIYLPVSVQHPIEAALRADIKPVIGHDRHDLAQRLRGEFRLIAGNKNPLAFFITVRDH